MVNVIYQVNKPGPGGFLGFLDGFARAAHIGTVGVKLNFFDLLGSTQPQNLQEVLP